MSDDTYEAPTVKKLGPFDFIDAMSHSKKDLIGESDDPDQTERLHNPFLANKAMSYHKDSILHANEMNSLHGLFPDANFRYYLNILRARKRISKWHKSTKNDVIERLCQLYDVNRDVASQYYALLTEEQRDAVLKTGNVGGAKK